MRYPGTVGVQVNTFKRVVADVSTAMRTNGFERIVLIGDHGSTQTPMKEVASELTSTWTDGKARIRYIAEYHDYPGLSKWAESLGIGVHSLAVDSKGNIFTGETYEGKRLQRFLYRGTRAPATGQR